MCCVAILGLQAGAIMSDLCGAGNRTQDFMYARQGLHQMSH